MTEKIWRPVEIDSIEAIKKMLALVNADLATTAADARVSFWLDVAYSCQGLKPAPRSWFKDVLPSPRQPLPFIAFTRVDYDYLTSDASLAVLRQLQVAFKQLFESLLEEAPLLSRAYITPPVTLSLAVVPDRKGKLRVQYLHQRNEITDLYLFHFVQRLEGFSVRSLHRCVECGNFFLGRRDKTYCSNPCAWRAAQRSNRRRNPDKYRKYMRQFMRNKYRQKCGLKPLTTNQKGGNGGCKST